MPPITIRDIQATPFAIIADTQAQSDIVYNPSSSSTTTKSTAQGIPSPPAKNVETCTFILPRKNRRCRMPVKVGNLFCVAHSHHLPTCPECGTRLPSDDALARHLSIPHHRPPLCPALRRRLKTESQPFYEHNVNICPSSCKADDDDDCDDDNDNNESAQWQCTMSMDDIETLVTTQVLHRICPLQLLKYRPMSDIPALQHTSNIHAKWSADRDSTIKLERKHFEQFINLSSLCIHSLLVDTPPTSESESKSKLNPSHPLEDPSYKDIAIMELGAGRAYMSLYLVDLLQAYHPTLQPHVLMVDRSTQRLKADRTLRKHRTLGSLHRITMDLRHLNLTEMSQLSNINILLIVAKHLCGSALDLALTCINDFVHHPEHCHRHVKLTFASCCRALCKWSHFGDRAAIWKSLQLTPTQVIHICKAAAWGLAPHHQSRLHKYEKKKEGINNNNDDHAKSKRACVGALCRKAVDVVRIKWLRDNGWHLHQLWTYTDASPESTCIVAEWKGTEALEK